MRQEKDESIARNNALTKKFGGFDRVLVVGLLVLCLASGYSTWSLSKSVEAGVDQYNKAAEEYRKVYQQNKILNAEVNIMMDDLLNVKRENARLDDRLRKVESNRKSRQGAL